MLRAIGYCRTATLFTLENERFQGPARDVRPLHALTPVAEIASRSARQGRDYPAVSAAAGMPFTIAFPSSERRRMAKGAVRLCTAEDKRIAAVTIAQSSS